jgi:hypothetical protein
VQLEPGNCSDEAKILKIFVDAQEAPLLKACRQRRERKPETRAAAGVMQKRSALLGLAVLVATAASVQASYTNIAWVSFHPGDNQPSAAVAALGFTQAPDAPYTQLLSAQGYNVTRFVTQDNAPSALINALNTNDLVIISRSVPSGHYEVAAETLAWNSLITKPMMILGGYVLRDNRLGFVTGNTIPDTTNTIRLEVLQPAHPIFAGISLDANNVMVNSYAQMVSVLVPAWGTNLAQRGISVVTDPLDGGGTLLARIASADAGPVEGTRMIIGEWPAGATLTPGGRSDVLGGPRMVFLTGSRESGVTGFTSEAAGFYDLVGDGPQLFLNAVAYMIPEPSSLGLLLLGGLPLLLWRRR